MMHSQIHNTKGGFINIINQYRGCAERASVGHNLDLAENLNEPMTNAIIKNVVGESIRLLCKITFSTSLLHQYRRLRIHWEHSAAGTINRAAYPSCIHIDINITAGIAQYLSARNAGGFSTPRVLSKLTIGPYLLYSSDQISETATIFEIYGIKISNLKTSFCR